MTTTQYYRPTPAETIGTWNVFLRTGETIRDVPWDDLPAEVQEYVRASRRG